MTTDVVIPWFGRDGDAPCMELYESQLSSSLWRVAMYHGRADESVAAHVAASRNFGARCGHADAIVFNDADSICQPYQIREAVRLAAEAPGLVFAFTNYCRLSQKTTESLTSWRDAFDAPVEWEMYGSNSSGCVAISRESFLKVGGYDETWLDGYEDYDFAFRCAEMFGPNRRVEGDLIHLWHPRPAVEPENGRDRERFETKWLAPR